MKKLRTLVLAALATVALLMMQPDTKASICQGFSFPPQPFAFETLTVSTVALPFTSATYAPTGQLRASVARFTVEAQPIRYREDGAADPTAAVGHLVAAAAPPTEICGTIAVANTKLIRQGGVDASVMVTFLR